MADRIAAAALVLLLATFAGLTAYEGRPLAAGITVFFAWVGFALGRWMYREVPRD